MENIALIQCPVGIASLRFKLHVLVTRLEIKENYKLINHETDWHEPLSINLSLAMILYKYINSIFHIVCARSNLDCLVVAS